MIASFMRIALIATAFVLTTGSSAFAQSQHEMNREAETSFEKADADLNRLYQKLLGELDAEGATKLRGAQRAWIVYRDAQAAYEADQDARGGSMYPQLYDGARAALTKLRVKELSPAPEPR